jgi:IS1 family transposase
MLSVEGMNKSAISRVKKIGWNTVHRWLERAGDSCRNYSSKTLKGFEIKELQADELCTFVGNKKKVTWIFTAMEVWSRLWPATVVGRRSYWNTFELLGQVQQKSEGNKRPLIVTDGFQFYEKAINKIFKVGCLYSQVIKTRRNNRIIKVERREIIGTETQFEEALHESEDSNTLNTSFIERLNLTIRQATSYLIRRTTCHARRGEQLENQLEIVRCYYNFLRPHKSLKFGKETRTPAMQAGLTNRRLSFREIFTIRFLLIILDRIRRLIGSVMIYETRAAQKLTLMTEALPM